LTGGAIFGKINTIGSNNVCGLFAAGVGVVIFRLEYMMKALKKLNSFTLRLCLIALFLCAFAAGISGCGFFNQPGETAAEGRRRHQRVLRINRQDLMSDIDTFFLMDEPSKLTEYRIP